MDNSDITENGAPTAELVEYRPQPSQEQPHTEIDLWGLLRRRWWVIVLLTALVWGIGFPAVFFLMPKQYRTTALVEVAPIIPEIIYRDRDSDQPLPNYEGFKNTQAMLMSSDKVIRRVAEEAQNLNLSFFNQKGDTYTGLRQMFEQGIIEIEPDRGSYLITLSMTTPAAQAEEARTLINLILRNYMAVVVEDLRDRENTRLNNLQNERKQLTQKLEAQQETIRQLVEEYGTGELTALQQMHYERLASLQRELTNTEIQLLALEAQIQAAEQGGQEALPSDFVQQRSQIVQNDPILRALQEDIRRYEQTLLVSRQTMQPNNPVLVQQEQVFETLKNRYEKRQQEVLDEFNAAFEERRTSGRQLQLAQLKTQRSQLASLMQHLQEKLQQQDAETIRIGRKQLLIEDLKEQIQQSKEQMQEVDRKIKELMIESKRPARISVADEAFSVSAPGKRKKMAAAVGFGGLLFGLLTALLIDRLDRRIHHPQEVVKRIQVRILGTTTDPHSIQRNLLGQQLNDDYQTIRANLGLLDGSNGSKIILVTSPGVQDGKTTFCVNLAASFANSGKKTLLIDADLRKPDVVEVLNLPRALRGFQDYLFGKRLEECLYRHSNPNFFILASDFRNSADALDLLAHPQSGERLRTLRDSFDVILIDSPPVLAFADALVLSRYADAVILTTFLGRTSQPDIQEALSRLRQVGAKVIGTVVNNVKAEQGYRSYGYGYAYGQKGRKHRKKNPDLFLTASQESSDTQTFPPNPNQLS
ncbi:MAG: polysaccharide biosynthesis tyrosine autokinase [Anaerohalosphaeraceae bacterium]